MKSLFEDSSKEELIERCEHMSIYTVFTINMIGDLSGMVINAFDGCDYKKLTEYQRELVNYLTAKGVLRVEKTKQGTRSKYIIKRVKDHYLIEELDKLMDRIIAREKENANIS